MLFANDNDVMERNYSGKCISLARLIAFRMLNYIIIILNINGKLIKYLRFENLNRKL